MFLAANMNILSFMFIATETAEIRGYCDSFTFFGEHNYNSI